MLKVFTGIQFGTMCLGFVGIILGMTCPLFKVADKYYVHLFPERDHIEYRVSEMHNHSQNLHIAASIFLGLSVIVCILETSVKTLLNNRKEVSGSVVLSVIGMSLYVAAIATLVEVGKGVKETPLKVRVDMEWGGIMDIIGLTSVLVGVLSSCAMTYGRREKQIKL